MDISSIFAIHLSLLEPFKLSTMQLIKLTVTIFLLSKTGDSMSVTTDHFKVSTNWKLSKNMEKTKLKYGEEVTIFHLLNSKSVTSDTPSMKRDIKTLTQLYCPKHK